MGRKSSRIFIGEDLGGRGRPGASGAAGRLEVYRRRVDAEALAGRLGAVLEHVAEVRAAVVAAHLDAHHAVARVDDALDDLAVDRLEVAGPAAAGVELGARVEQRRAATHAAVAAFVPVVPVLAA